MTSLDFSNSFPNFFNYVCNFFNSVCDFFNFLLTSFQSFRAPGRSSRNPPGSCLPSDQGLGRAGPLCECEALLTTVFR